MTRFVWCLPRLGVSLAALIGAGTVHGQDNQPSSSAQHAVDPASVPMPNLAFTADAEIERNYFKYFFFHRVDTDFAAAYSDLQECDGLARGLTFGRDGGASAAGAFIGGGVPGLLGAVIGDAVFGSSERRRQRRVNMRTCMGYKGYTTFGLPRNLWSEFNFDEGNSGLSNSRRQEFLRLQARAATGPRPTIGEMR